MDLELEQALRTNSPRITPRPARWSAWAIWGGAILLFLFLFAQAFVQTGVLAWAVGLVYVGYDTLLLLFVATQTDHIPRRVPAEDGNAGTTEDVSGSTASPPSLCAIIAAHNEAPVLQATIEALRTQSQPPELILIADDGSTDDTPATLAAAYGLDTPRPGTLGAPGPIVPELRWLRLPHGGKANALNAALAHADTDIVVTVDADTLADDDAIAAIRRHFAAEPVLVAATGVLRPICGRGLQGRLFQWCQTYEYVRNFLSRYAWMRQDSLLLISGAFAAFRRKALVAVGGFDAACLVEDYEVIHRLHRHAVEHGLDWRVRALGDVTATTDAPGALMPFLRQRRRWFAGFLQTQYWNRDMIGNGRFGKLGRLMLPVKALDTVQPVYGVAAFVLLVVFAATGKLSIALPIVYAMAAKVVIDLTWLLVSLRRYRLWTGQRLGATGAILVAIVEPVSFQLLRHVGATWGWISLATGRLSWGKQHRAGILART